MLYVGIDLAERHSAALILNDDLKVLFESTIDTGPTQKAENPYLRIAAYRAWWKTLLNDGVRAYDDFPEAVHYCIEEPYPHAVKVGPAYRMQGALMAEMQADGITEECIRVTLAKPWQDYFGYTKKEFGNSKAWAELMCVGFGYVPGLLLGSRSKVKQREDLRDAYLLARWLKETL